MEWPFIDGSHIKVHQYARAGVGKEAAVGHSRGSNTAKIHLAVAGSNPVAFKITRETVNDITAAPELLDDELDLSSTGMLGADKGGDSDAFRQLIAGKGVRQKIPYKKIGDV
ncbi:transposase [Neisseria iguanae]|uniref:Transposase IS4-like domain-containing protein n=1 Tax=Neisseria iguanae TaxID=90242 RepID=A0A2P7TYE3_9NEIS|nr:hypothetical protein C7N83_10340 [Neisseria iguanae]